MFNPEQYSQAQSLIKAHIRSFDTCAKAVLHSSAGLINLAKQAHTLLTEAAVPLQGLFNRAPHVPR